MFQSVACTLELSKQFGLENYDFMLSVQFEAEQRLPLSKFELYSYTVPGTVYYYGFRRQKAIMHEVAVCCVGQFKEDDFIEGFRIFSYKLELFEPRQVLMFMGDQYLLNPLIPIIEEHDLKHEEYPGINYYMSKEQQELLMATPPLPVPEGYELGSCSPEDAELITDVWIHKAPGEEEQTRMKVTVFPSSCIRYQGNPVAFEVIHANGMQNHLFVMKEHQGKGLGYIVEQDLARKQIREGLFIYKTVETFNHSVIKHTNESPYWTVKKKADGSPLIKQYMAIWPKEMDPNQPGKDENEQKN